MGTTASIPISEATSTSQPLAANAIANLQQGCPMNQKVEEQQAQTAVDIVNPLNNIPALAQGPVSASQRAFLSLERSTSSIPRSRSNRNDVDSKAGASPSACPVVHDIGKGKGRSTGPHEAEAEAAERWVYPSPQQFYNALMRKGKDTPEESVDTMVQIHNWLNEKAWDEVRRWEDRRSPNERIELTKFEGRPQDLSPKARFHLLLGGLFPNIYK